jgi:hypothetical protein
MSSPNRTLLSLNPQLIRSSPEKPTLSPENSSKSKFIENERQIRNIIARERRQAQRVEEMKRWQDPEYKLNVLEKENIEAQQILDSRLEKIKDIVGEMKDIISKLSKIPDAQILSTDLLENLVELQAENAYFDKERDSIFDRNIQILELRTQLRL